MHSGDGMVKTIEEFKDELRALRREMFANAEVADTKLVASWVDRLAISLEGLSDSLQAIEAELDTCGECCSAPAMPVAKKAKKAKPAKKAKKAKPAKKKKRR
jgi:hypothetical protein